MKIDFNKEELEFFLPDRFKGLTKEYILDKIYDKSIQESWIPSVGDVIVGPTGNVFVISNIHKLDEKLGGTLYFFGGNLCNRTGGSIMNETMCYTMNRDGKWYTWEEGKVVTKDNPYHSKVSEFRYVPYPHEL